VKPPEPAPHQTGCRIYRPQSSVGFRTDTIYRRTTSSHVKISFSDLVMDAMVHPSPILRPDEPIMRNPDRDEEAAIFSLAPFRSRDRASTHHLGGTLYAGLFREKQSHFERGMGLSPILSLEQHPRTTDVSGGTTMPVAFTLGSITQRNLQFEALSPSPFTQTNTAYRVQHGLYQSWLISSGFTKDA